MSKSFQERAALQRRQAHHQQLLDSQRFDVASHGGPRQSHPNDVNPAAGGGFFALIALVFVLIFALYAAMTALLSVVAAVPVALALTTLARAMPYHAEIGYARTYVAAFIGILSYLTITLVIVSCAGFVSQPDPHPGFLIQLADAIVETHHLATASAYSFSSGEIVVAGFFGFPAERGHSIPVLVAALTALHGPGLLVCGAVLSNRIGQSYRGVRGFLIACAVSLAAVPTSLVAVIWSAAVLYKRYH